MELIKWSVWQIQSVPIVLFMTGRLNAVFLSYCLTFHLIKTVHLTIDIYSIADGRKI